MSAHHPIRCHGPAWTAGLMVISRLQEAGHHAAAVGGCVRDALLGLPVHDVDVVSDAGPAAVEAIFPRTVAVGRAFGIIVVVTEDGHHIEVATYRSDGAYIDGRHPTGTSDADEETDAWRRDFTINALYYDPIAADLRDHVGGLADIDQRILRGIGDPAARLVEDRLRLLRAVRFSSHLDLTIETQTCEAMYSGDLSGISGERICQEWRRGLAHARAVSWLQILAQQPWGQQVCPAVDADHIADRRLPLQGCAGSWQRATMVLLDHDDLFWLEVLPFSKQERSAIAGVVSQLPDLLSAADPVALCRRLVDTDHADHLRHVSLVCCVADQRPALAAAWYDAHNFAKQRTRLGGRDLRQLGIPPGPHMGRLLRELDDEQIRHGPMTSDQARDWIRNRWQQDGG